nr:hypothetical protein CFP56_00530 [Quercus suber]
MVEIPHSLSHSLYVWGQSRSIENRLLLPMEYKNRGAAADAKKKKGSGFRELFLAEEREEADADGDLRQHADPEPGVRQARETGAEVGEGGPRADAVQSVGAGDHGGDAADDLGGDEREADVEAHHGLQQDHAVADALDAVEDAEPEPEPTAEDGGAER